MQYLVVLFRNCTFRNKTTRYCTAISRIVLFRTDFEVAKQNNTTSTSRIVLFYTQKSPLYLGLFCFAKYVHCETKQQDIALQYLGLFCFAQKAMKHTHTHTTNKTTNWGSLLHCRSNSTVASII